MMLSDIILPKLITFILVKLILICVVSNVKEPVVQTPLGEVSGYYMKTRGGRQISAFTSIPYAVPPVADMRFKVGQKSNTYLDFVLSPTDVGKILKEAPDSQYLATKAPMPIAAWEETLDATKPTPKCIQRNPYIRQKEIIGQEDCLYLNIYTPVSSSNELVIEKKLPVMVFLHGGGWMCGDSTTYMYGPEYLLDEDILLVTINYRLGPLGFLSTQDEHCPGNNGLKDQQEAFRLIQKVIESFGGDKNSVTIFGESAGGASVHYHMLSKTSSGLFHKGISESGTALAPWTEATPGEALRNAFRLAKILDCPQAPSERMIACLRTKDGYDIINTEFKFYVWDYEPMTPFKAVVEPDLPGAFLTRNQRKVPDVNAVPWMTGLNSDEGCLKSGWITSNATRLQEYISGFQTIAPVTFYYENSPYVDHITRKIKDFYLHGQKVDDVKTGIRDIYMDSYFSYPVIEAVALTFNYTKSPVYLYELTYKASNSFSQIFGDPEGSYGVCHADELMYLFPIHFLNKPHSEQDIEMSKLIITLWTNFATSGNPNKPKDIPFKWKPATSSKKMEYLNINAEPSMKRDLAARSRFWSTLPLWHSVRSRPFVDEL